MTPYKGTKLKTLLTTWPQGTVFLSSVLKGRGIGYDLQMQYRKSGWIQSIGQGAVVRTGDNVSWQGGVYALQTQAKLPLHVGGKTALSMYGLAHFVNMMNEKIQIFGSPGSKLPTWFQKYSWGGRIIYHRSSLFSEDLKSGLQSRSLKSFSIEVSSPERAFLEFLDLVPQEETFREAILISESLSVLRPKIVQELLEACRSVKVKRLFLFLIEKQNHAWFKRLNVSRIALGKGDRQIFKGGVLDQKYRITVPQDLK